MPRPSVDAPTTPRSRRRRAAVRLRGSGRLGGALPVRPRRIGRQPSDAGMATAEYAIATLAACGFAGLLLALMRSDEVRTLLSDVIRRALSLS